MSKLEKRIHDEKNGLDYVLVGDYYIPALIFPEGRRHIGKWGRMHRAYSSMLTSGYSRRPKAIAIVAEPVHPMRAAKKS